MPAVLGSGDRRKWWSARRRGGSGSACARSGCDRSTTLWTSPTSFSTSSESRSMPLTSSVLSRWAAQRSRTWSCVGRPLVSMSSTFSAPIVTLSADDLVVCAGETPASISGSDRRHHHCGDQLDEDSAAGSRELGWTVDSRDVETAGAAHRRIDTFRKRLERSPPAGCTRSRRFADRGTVRRPRPRWVRGAVAAASPELGPIDLTARFTSDLLGIPIDATEIGTTLARLGFAVEQDGGTLTVMPPYFRRDVSLREDLVEEVGRMIGYSRVPSTLPGRRVPVTATASHAPIDNSIRDTCVGAGFDEAITLRVRRGRRRHAVARDSARAGNRSPCAIR